MPWDFITAIPKDYASGIGTVVGATIAFIGVTLSMLSNAWLARRADQRRYENDRAVETLKLAHERRVLRVSIKAELSNLIRIYTREVEYVDSHNFTWVPILDFFGSYRENLGKIGLMSADEVQRITDAYYTFNEEVGYVARLGKADLTKPLVGTNIGFNFLKNKTTKDYLRGFLKAIVDEARKAVETIDIEIYKDERKRGIFAELVDGLRRL